MAGFGCLILFPLLLSPLVLHAADSGAFASGEIATHRGLHKPEGIRSVSRCRL
jgi:hypothetical protein